MSTECVKKVGKKANNRCLFRISMKSSWLEWHLIICHTEYMYLLSSMNTGVRTCLCDLFALYLYTQKYKITPVRALNESPIGKRDQYFSHLNRNCGAHQSDNHQPQSNNQSHAA